MKSLGYNLIAVSGKIGSGKDEIYDLINFFSVTSENYHSYENYQKYKRTPSPATYFRLIKFADKLKDAVCVIFGVTRAQIENREFREKRMHPKWDVYVASDKTLFSIANEDAFKVYEYKLSDTYLKGDDLLDYRQYLTIRRVLQLLGTEAGRRIIHPDLWVNATFEEYDSTELSWEPGPGLSTPIYPYWLITDLRFPNELRAVNDRNGLPIRIEMETWRRVGLKEKMSDIEVYEYLLVNNVSMLDSLVHESETSLDGLKSWPIKIENNGSLEDLFLAIKEVCKNTLNLPKFN